MSSSSKSSSDRLVASFLQFLDDEVKRTDIPEDDRQGIEVACQCLQAAYTVTATDVPSDQKKLVDIFTDLYPDSTEPKRDLTEEEKEKAESFKIEGNGYMKNGAFDEAISSYNKAIQIDPSNAVYYCNRAAAQTGKQAYDRALTDCRKALEIDPDYSKAYSRMGLTYSKMEAFDSAVECYEKALKLDPDNEGYKKNLKIATDKASGSTMGTGAGSGGGGFPGSMMGGMMPGMGAGMGQFAEMLNNPQFMNMAKTVMEDPQMKEMATQMMSRVMGGGETSGSADSGMPPLDGNLANIMSMGQQFAQQMTQEHPEVVERLRDQMQNNMSANNPADNGDEDDKKDETN